MNVKRYFAPTAREALRALKEALGPDAIVLSNRAVEGGVEILALPGEAVGALQAANRAVGDDLHAAAEVWHRFAARDIGVERFVGGDAEQQPGWLGERRGAHGCG